MYSVLQIKFALNFGVLTGTETKCKSFIQDMYDLGFVKVSILRPIFLFSHHFEKDWTYIQPTLANKWPLIFRPLDLAAYF